MVLILDFLNGGNNILSRSERLGLYAVELLIQIEVNVTHFEIVTSDLDLTREIATLKSVDTLPFTAPECLKLGIEATEFDDLVVFSVGTLSDLETDLSGLESVIAILLYLCNQVVSKLACRHLHGLFRYDGTFKLKWIKRECDTLGAIIILEILVEPSVSRDHDNLAIW